MQISCPIETCTDTFESAEALAKHEGEVHSTIPNVGLPEIGNNDPSRDPKSTASHVVGSELPLRENSTHVESSRHLEQHHLLHNQHSATLPKSISTQLETKSSSAVQIMSFKNEKTATESEECARQKDVAERYRRRSSSTTPRSCEWRTTLLPRNLEDGLKDSSLGELLGYSSSDEESDDGFSNYSF